MASNRTRFQTLKSIAAFARKHRKILVGCFTAVVGGGILANDWGYASWDRFHIINQQKEIYPFTPEFIHLPSEINYDNVVEDYPEENKTFWFSRQTHGEKFMHWKLLQLSKSKSRQVRQFTLKALVELPGMTDSSYREIAQASDFDTSVGLARIQGTDSRFFLPPPAIPEDMNIDRIDNELRRLLMFLPIQETDPCLQFFTVSALKTGFMDDEVSGGRYSIEEPELVGAEESVRPHIPRQEASVALCLQALLRHSIYEDCHALLVHNSLLPLLQRVQHQWPQNHRFHSLIAQIIGNLALSSEMHRHIFASGWVGILAAWFSSKSSLEVSLTAARALANMDQDNGFQETYQDGIYALHPLDRQKNDNIEADIVLVHGLLGGAFKTWRQHDSKKGNADQYTSCWPKDWLAVDFPKCRIIAVDYDSQLSNWMSKCPIDDKSRTLSVRSEELVEKLLAAGFGDRPIIWISHSMGGLLVKHLLLHSWDSQDIDRQRLVENTRGLVFYSVPHKGSLLANLKSSLQYLFLPSAEVKELKDSPQMKAEHERLVSLLKTNDIKCLSFGETLRTSLGFRWTLLIVPPESADPGIGIFHTAPVNHLDSCKPEAQDSPLYRNLVQFIISCLYSQEEAQMLFQQGSKMTPLEMALMIDFS